MRLFSMTDIGKRRELNEDYIFTSGDPVGGLDNLFVVADGMGGHNAGDYASEHAVKILVDTIRTLPESDEVQSILSQAVEKANSFVYDCSVHEEALSGMGSTMVLATVKNGEAVIANVGDSRLYLIRNEEIHQITQDHSFVEEMVKLGEINEDEARNHPDKNIITRAIGVKSSVLVDFFNISLEKEDKFLMCSDGLTNMITDQEILDIILHNEVEEAVKKLIEAANNNGGRDNIAVVLVEPFGGC